MRSRCAASGTRPPLSHAKETSAHMKMPAFEYACPTTLSEAVSLLASGNGEAKLLAGGQSLVPMLAFRLAQPALLVDLRKVPDLRKIDIGSNAVALGSM